MHMKPLRKIIPPDYSDVMIAYVMGGEAGDANPTNYERNNSARTFNVNQDEKLYELIFSSANLCEESDML